MDERLKFVARLLDGEKMAVLCREFGISRKTGYKLINRYNDSGLEGLTDRSRRPYRHANQLPFQIEKLIVPSRTSRTGARRRSGSGWCGSIRTFISRLSVWWLRLGIAIERIKPGCPQQNGRHERMHLTLKLETTKPAAANFLQQQARFDDFVEEFNTERPHQALDMACPAERYSASPRPYKGLPEIDYPFHDKAVTVTTCGRICYNRKKINLSQVFAGQTVGVKQVDDRIWLASFMDYDLGYFDDETCRLEPLENPFGPKVLPMSPV